MASPFPAGSPAPGGIQWTTHFSPDGRPFWYNPANKQSVWEKPEELKTPMEREMSKTPWKEYETKGRKYWVHKESKETTWDMPPVLREIIGRFAPAGGFPAMSPQQAGMGSPMPGGAPSFVAAQGLPPRPAGPVTFHSQEEAERGFMDMLAELKVTADWPWERVIREAITHPVWKALKDSEQRKVVFERYLRKIEEDARLELERSLDKCRKEFQRAMERLGGGPLRPDGPKSWWSWNTKRRQDLERRMPAEVWRLPRNDNERRILFSEYIDNLKAKDVAREEEIRNINLEKVSTLIRNMDLDLVGSVKWAAMYQKIVEAPEFKADEQLRKMEDFDILAAFEEEVDKAERVATDQRQAAKQAKRREARKAREGFMAVLEELRSAGHIRAGTQWKEIYPRVEQDDRYLNLLGLPGSSPIDLFWDVVDEMDAKIEADERRALDILRGKQLRFEEGTTLETFKEMLGGELKMDDETLEVLYDMMHAKSVRHARERRRHEEHRLRNQIEDLRYAIRDMEPPIKLDATFEDALPRIAKTREFRALEDNEEAQRTAFDRFVRREKEKLRERERERSVEDSTYSSSRRSREARRAPMDLDDDSSDRRRSRDGRDRRHSSSVADSPKVKRSRLPPDADDDLRSSKRSRQDRMDVEEGELEG